MSSASEPGSLPPLPAEEAAVAADVPSPPPPAAERPVLTPALLLFTLTLFLSATLLFLVQPLAGKMILPLFGGTPGVWIACMLFFQALLLAGYRYADLLATRLAPRQQALVHIGVILLPLAAFFLAPVGVVEGLAPSTQVGPALGVFLILLQLVGVPFFVVSSTAPLLQKWFGGTDDPSARDPYFLYAASNLGSMIALLGFPFLLEPNLRLRSLGTIWMVGYGLLALLIVLCAALVLRSQRAAAATAEAAPRPVDTGAGPGLLTRLRWVLLAFVPTSLMLGVTTYMTTDIAAVPLLWILPLSLYLLTFILVFSKTMAWLHDYMVMVFPVAVLLMVFLMISEVQPNRIEYRFLIHLGGLFVTAMVCHGELAKARPANAYLTTYYLCLSIGGVLGGAFNGLLAPHLFNTVAEYPLILALACVFMPPLAASEENQSPGLDLALTVLLVGGAGYFLYLLGKRLLSDGSNLPDVHAYGWKSQPLALGLTLLLAAVLGRYIRAGWFTDSHRRQLAAELGDTSLRTGWRSETWQRVLDVLLPAALGLVTFSMIVLTPFRGMRFDFIREWIAVPPAKLQQLFTYIPVVAICYGFAGRPVRLALGVSALLAASAISINTSGVLYQERSFFGVHRVELDDRQLGHYHSLAHGTTIHGMQRSPRDPVLVRSARSGAVLILASSTPLESAVAVNTVGERLRDIRIEPMAYFHPRGPIGQLFAAMNLRARPPQEIAILGLGTGTLAGWLRPGQTATIYEIDDVAVKIAEDPRLFTYLRDTRGQYQIIMGDGRLKLAEAADGQYDLLFMDAFSSDSIPVHLVTREAIDLYFRKLKPDGVLVINVANRYLNAAPVLANIARDLKLVGMVCHDSDNRDPPSDLDILIGVLGEQEAAQVADQAGHIPGKFDSSWVVLARQPESLGLLADNVEGIEDEARINALQGLFQPTFTLPYLHLPFSRWSPLSAEEDPSKGIWTDDYSNLFRILNR